MAPSILFTCTYGEDAPERATVPFIAAGVAATSGIDAAVVCTAEAVRIGTQGVADRIHHEGMPTLRELYDRFVGAGGEVWLCSACTTVRGIAEDDVVDGARIVGAAEIVAAIADGATNVALT